MSLAPTIALADGTELPQVGLGTWPLTDAEAETAVAAGLGLGYRLIDTAAMYGNEMGVGRGLAASGVPREDVRVTTKLAGAAHGYESTLEAFETSRRKLGLEYVDLYLIHWPQPHLGRYIDTWRAFVHLQEEGLVRSIGVSNFLPDHIDQIVEETGVTPVVDQIESHPGFTQDALREELTRRGIAVEAYSPLGSTTPLFHEPAIRAIADAHDRSPAQIVLRWHIEVGSVPIPKSSHPERMAENLALFDFELTDAERSSLAGLERGDRLGGDPATEEG